MDILDDLLPKKPESTPIIQKDADAVKYDAVAAKLCEKRKSIEEVLKDPALDQVLRDEKAMDLLQLRDSMRTFGITEIDYQAYLAYKEREGGVQLELF